MTKGESKQNKKIVNLILVACMILSLFTLCACGEKTPAEPEAQAQEYTLGMGVMINTDSSKENQTQVDATFAGVVLDAEGKIVSCRLDCVQNKMDVSYSFPQAIFASLGAGLGYILAMMLFAGVQSRIQQKYVPAAFKGLPINVLAAAIISMALVAFK